VVTLHTFVQNCRIICDTKAEEYVIITADMSGAELRIIAELANDPVWIAAFNRGEDVHSVGTELLYPEEWPKLQYAGQLIKDKNTGGMVAYWCEYYKLHTEETVKKFPNATVGQPMRQKCKCPGHEDLRNDNKSTNFLLAYGGGPFTLAKRIKKTKEVATALMERHKAKFPRIWAYLDESGRMAKIRKKAFDMFGRRRIFPEPTQERARLKALDDREEQLRYEPEEVERNLQTFMTLNKRKPNKEELWIVEHRQPTQKEISNAFMALHGNIERQGKNHSIQGTNASIAKLAMGSGYDKDGTPYLWHLFPRYKATLVKFVHDELVVQAPKRYALQVKALIGDAFKRAAATKMHRVVMEFDASIAGFWKK
jgi:DNA polymerase I-like protein with 3'-5' exonuclease and polymerase domains